MNRRSFLTASLLSVDGVRTAGQMAHSPFSTEAPGLLASTAGALPDLAGVSKWLNTTPLTRSSLRGRVTLVNFWTYSCINSLRPLPYLKKWAAQYRDDGLFVLGVHSPEFSFEKLPENVRWALREFNITYPVAMDNDYAIWRAFHNEYWPAFYIVDGKGRIRYRRFGEGQYDQTERAIQALLEENGAIRQASGAAPTLATGVEAAPSGFVHTPETYVGYRRAERFSSPERVRRDSRKVYSTPAMLPLNQWGLSGLWEIGAESGLVHETKGKLTFRFRSRDLHLVQGPKEGGKSIRFRIALDGAAPGRDAGGDCSGDGQGEVRLPRLYQLVRQQGEVRERLFEIEYLDPGSRAYAFTFG